MSKLIDILSNWIYVTILSVCARCRAGWKRQGIWDDSRDKQPADMVHRYELASRLLRQTIQYQSGASFTMGIERGIEGEGIQFIFTLDIEWVQHSEYWIDLNEPMQDKTNHRRMISKTRNVGLVNKAISLSSGLLFAANSLQKCRWRSSLRFWSLQNDGWPTDCTCWLISNARLENVNTGSSQLTTDL